MEVVSKTTNAENKVGDVTIKYAIESNGDIQVNMVKAGERSSFVGNGRFATEGGTTINFAAKSGLSFSEMKDIIGVLFSDVENAGKISE